MSKLPFPFRKLGLPLLFLSLLSIPFCVISQGQATDELAALLNLKQQWGNPPALQSWTSSSPTLCGWPEINCTGGSVTGLLLEDMNITEPIPPSICDLKSLTQLNLSWNYIPGGFPRALYNCSKLQILDLSQNYFVGPIPSDIDQLSGLTYLDVGGNNFSGDIPAEIGRLRGLQTLNLYQNQFNGTFPKEIGDLANLEVLRMAYNDEFVPAMIPKEFGQLKKLRFLWMKQCNLIDGIPESFSNLSSLEHLDLSGNALTGGIPGGLFSLQNLSYVYLFHNQLSGALPTSISSKNLIEIDLAMNDLTGSIPEDFGTLQSLRLLNLFWNQLSGHIPVGIAQLPSLIDFRVFDNKLSGVLPPEFGLYSPLEAFEISNNNLSGELPKTLCTNGVLLGVVAYSNNLSGQVPESLGNCNSLRTIQLYNNNFSGELPSGIWTLLNLSSLTVSQNSFSGGLPRKLAWNLSRVEISNNRFSGPIPAEVSSWSSLAVLKASNNLFSGNVPEELTSLSRLIVLSMDGNQLSGELPSKIISWKSLTSLNFSKNNLSGQIPAALGSLPDLLDLDLSDNKFSGVIPPELGNLRLTTLNLSSNRLGGRIPDGFNNLVYENSFLSNPDLCAGDPMPNIRSCYTRSSKSNKVPSKYLALILVLAIAAVLAAVLFALFVIREYWRKKLRRDLATWKLTSFQRLGFTEASILSNLTDNTIIGSGGSGKVYRVAVNDLGDYVAVKRIWNSRKLDWRQEKEFAAEVEILGSIRHSNIVKLLCCISSENSKLLVYEYMENQSLDKWLHRNKRASTLKGSSPRRALLDWPTRLQIAKGAAQGLGYMHHDCSPPIIHRDVKSSNILLDFQFKAKVADFGLAKMLAKHGESHDMSAVAGSFGYFAPEYAYSTKVNEKIDVYSFGVVLLELVTGRQPNSGDENTSLTEWAWRHYVEGKPITDALDEEIKEPCNVDEMATVFKLALVCTSRSPSTRPPMKEVLHILQKCSPSDGKKVGPEFDFTPLLGTATYLSSYRRSKKADDSLVYSA
ncbi:receptor-like protein kinase HSL1 [Rhodamnia argentea]|uniref:Receptor-like protein kinase HSL1 n=1 Tax=Rhodamnia argentea TaxID=178133 RepID=A0A8B8MSA8_9MYRT|nr:receptor-like protein kinase HSL1 [Rhodamnia argentea]XP_048133636.1 receptor-like protein kinase HSL1 [Rhodamnia argentea]